MESFIIKLIYGYMNFKLKSFNLFFQLCKIFKIDYK